MQRRWRANAAGLDAGLLAEDVVIEMPFAPADRPRRWAGREAFLAFAGPQQAAFGGRFEDVRNVVVHDTADPEVIVVEYELAGTVKATGRRAAAPFIGVLRVRNGRIAHWREYQDVPAIAEALGQVAGAPQDCSRPAV